MNSPLQLKRLPAPPPANSQCVIPSVPGEKITRRRLLLTPRLTFYSLRTEKRPPPVLRRSLPVVGEGFVVLGVERAGGGEHDGGVQIGDDPRHGAGCRDAGLSSLVACLEG